MTRATRPRAVVFDLDGTLVDSLPLVLQSIAHAIEPYGARPTMEIFARLGGPPERFLPALLDDRQNVPAALDRMDAFHRANRHLIRPFDGTVRALDRLRFAGVQLAIWTGRDRESTEHLLAVHQFAGYFATIMCGDDLPTHKPDPEGLREIMRRLEVTAAETLFVGDADVDVLGGTACGVDTVLIRNARTVEAHITAQSWRSVGTPLEAFEVVLGCVG
jgi:pyrophosphatase PpaX